MTYTPTVWETGDVITAEKLNKAENGIEAASEAGIIPLSFTYGTPVYGVPSEGSGYVPVTLSAEIDNAHLYSVTAVPDLPDIGVWQATDGKPNTGVYHSSISVGEEGGLYNLTDGVGIYYSSDYGYIVPIRNMG